jgi:4-amino-4-deoxy-L-arabinose transferase-like glycosyltransferase
MSQSMMSQSTGEDWALEKRLLIGVTVVFAALNVGLRFIFAAPETLIEADSLTLLRMAEQFLATGTFAEETRQPLYPVIMAAALRLGGDSGLSLLISLQIAMLYGTGLFAWAIARPWLHGASAVVFGLVILNPNAIGFAHWPLADTLHALIFTAAMWAILSYALKGRMSRAAVCGIALGLAAMTRPETTLLVYFLPIAFPLVHWLAKRPKPIRDGVPAGLVAIAFALAMALPWMIHNNAAGNGFSMTGGSKASDSSIGHFAIIEAARINSTEAAEWRNLKELEPQILAEAGLADATQQDQRQFLTRYYLGRTFEASPVIILKLYAKAWVAQFASGGAQSINLLLGYELDRTDKFMNEKGAISAFFGGMKGEPVAVAITIGAVAFSLLARVLGLIGLVVVTVRRHWALLLVIIAVVAFKGLVHLFFGLSRYRLSVEPSLMILAVYGWQGLRSVWPSRH